MSKPLTIEDIAKASYEKYCAYLKANGIEAEMAPWGLLPIRNQNAWVEAVQHGIQLAIEDAQKSLEG